MAPHRYPPIITIEPLPLQLQPPASSSPEKSCFPIFEISILGILATCILLLSYYIIVIRCCLGRHRDDSIRLRLSQSLRRRFDGLPFSAIYSSTAARRGLDESTIQAIPTLKFKRSAEQRSPSTHECVVCLAEFQQDETIKLLPNCLHVFHIDCIGTWLQTSTNCPLCRAEITRSSTVVIDVGDEVRGVDADTVNDCSPSVCGSDRKLRKLSSMGDEGIDVRGRGDRFGVQPVRRSFSMDSLSNQQLYRAVQKILRQNQHFKDVGNGEGTSSSSGRSHRSSFFLFGGHCRSSNQQ